MQQDKNFIEKEAVTVTQYCHILPILFFFEKKNIYMYIYEEVCCNEIRLNSKLIGIKCLLEGFILKMECHV